MRRSVAALTVAAGLGALSLLSACSNGASPEASPVLPSAGVSNPERSWMAADATNQDLFYISDRGTNEVYAYSYPQGTLEGALTDFRSPAGLCVDKAGDIWVSEQGSGKIKEYAHGGTKAIAVLDDPGEVPVSCAVDPTTGNLAVANYYRRRESNQGSIAIFTGAKGKPTFYMGPLGLYGYFCGYDDKGNLFVDGTSHESGGFLFEELAKGSARLRNITLTGGTIYFPGQVQWDGKYVAVGDQTYQRKPGASAIFRTTGAGGKIVGVTTLTGYGDVVEFWIERNTLVAPNYSARLALLYKYPAGGFPKRTVTGLRQPFGAVVSLASGE
jgi:DNA-binding beta-propeller fold protein YncE